MKIYRNSELPDHLSHEISQMVAKFTDALEPILEDKDTQTVLGALNRLYALFIVFAYKGHESKALAAGKLHAECLIKNVKSILEEK